MKRRGVVSNVDHYENARFGVKVPISLNKDSGDFSAEYAEETIYAPTLTEIKKKIHDEVFARVGLPWVPVIEVTISGSSYSFTDVLNNDMHGDETYQRKHARAEGDLRLHAKRYWIAKRTDGVWMECDIWDSVDYSAENIVPTKEFLSSDDRRINAHEFHEGRREKAGTGGDFSLPHSREDRGEQITHYLEYDESLWQALNAIGDKIGELHAQLQKLVGTAQGRKRLAVFAQRLLSGGK